MPLDDGQIANLAPDRHFPATLPSATAKCGCHRRLRVKQTSQSVSLAGGRRIGASAHGHCKTHQNQEAHIFRQALPTGAIECRHTPAIDMSHAGQNTGEFAFQLRSPFGVAGTTLRNTLPAQSDTGEPGVSVHGIVEPVFAPLPKRRFQTCGMDSEKRSEDPQRRSFDTARHAGQTHRSAAGFKAQGNRLLMVLAMVCGEKVQNAVVATGSLEKMIA